jgi:hypothetical protein
MASLKIYGGPWNVYLNRKAKIYLKKHNLQNMQTLCSHVYDC